jgi:hypothetical protein
MEQIGLTISAPVSLLILACAYALILGADGRLVAKVTALCVPIAAYVVFSVFTVLWALKIGEIGIKQEMTLQAKLHFWHGMSVVLVIILSAAGSFILLFFTQMKGLLGHGIPG